MGVSSQDSMLRSISSGSLLPSAEKNFTPLSSNGLCDAEITIPACIRSARTRYAMAGVGMGPDRSTSTPAADNPASNADSSIYPDIRVSLPISTVGRAPSIRCQSEAASTLPAEYPRCRINSGVMGSLPTRPRIPSVPKYLLVNLIDSQW